MSGNETTTGLDIRGRISRFITAVGAILSLCYVNNGLAQIFPPADRVGLPDAYFEQIRRDATSYQFTRSLIQKTQKIRENRQGYLTGDITLQEAERRGGIMVAGTSYIPVLTGKFANTGADPYPVSNLQTELFTGPWPTGTMTDYYSEISYGNLTVTGTVFNWVTALQNDSYYEGTCNGLGTACSKTGEFLKEILDANDPSVDFGQYDNDGPDGIPNSGDDDGYVDFAAFVQPESGGECGNSNIWSHRWVYSAWWGSAYTTNDPAAGGGFIKINDYVIQPAFACDNTTMIQIGVFCHEFGHAFGLPDLYDTDGSSAGIGYWGLMGTGSWNTPSSPAHMSAWSKEQMGWIIPTVISASSTITINNVEFNSEALKLWTDGAPGQEYFLVENRQAVGFDANLRNSGLSIWHIDNNISSNQNEWYPGLNPISHYMVAVEQADGNWDLEHNNNPGDAGDPFPGSTSNTAFNGASTPNSDSYTSGPSYVSIVNISPSGDPMTADVSVSSPLVFRVERSTGDVYADGSFIGGGADLAERINVSESVEPGDVVELDPAKPEHYRKSRGPSDLIAGVITTEPGFTLGNNPEEEEQASEKAAGRPMLALMGRVPIKATTENGPIRPGDLLTVAGKPGYAMRCADIKTCTGTIIGKALETLDRGEGKILALVMSH